MPDLVGRGAGISGTLFDLATVSGGTIRFHGRAYGWNLEQQVQQLTTNGPGTSDWLQTLNYMPSGVVVIVADMQSAGPPPEPSAIENATGQIEVQFFPGQKETIGVNVTKAVYNRKEKDSSQPAFTLTCQITSRPQFTGWTGSQPDTGTTPSLTQPTWEGRKIGSDPQGLLTESAFRAIVAGPVYSTSDADIALIAAGAAAVNVPSAQKLRPSGVERVSSSVAIVTLAYGYTDTKDDWINARTSETVDPAKLQTGGTAANINATPTVPTVAGQTTVARKTTFIPINDAHTGQETEYGQRDTKDDVQMDGTQAKVDESGMDSEGQNTAVFAHGSSPPADASAPDASLQATHTLIQELNRDEKKKITFFQVNTTAEQWVYDRGKRVTDPSDIKDLTILGAIYTTGSEPSAPGASGLVLNHKEYFTVASPATSNLSGVLWFYAETTSADDEIFPRSKLDTDPYDLTSEAITGAIVTTGASLGSPSAPNPPPHMVLAHWLDAPLTDAAASNKSVRLYFWALRTSQDAVEMDGTRAKVDEAGIESEGEDTAVYTTAGGVPPDAASPDASLKAVAHATQELNRIKSKHVTYFDVNSSIEKLLFGRQKSNTDPGAIRTTKLIGSVYTTGSEPSAPGSSGLVLRDTERITVTSPDTSNLSATFWLYAETTTADDLIFEKSKVVVDAQSLDNETFTGEIVTTGSSATNPGTPSGLKLIDHADQPLTDASASNKSLRIWKYGKRDSADDRTLPKIFFLNDANNISDTAMVAEIWTSGSAPGSPAIDPTASPWSLDVKLIDYRDVPLVALDVTPLKYLRLWNFGPRNSKDEKILANYETITDASGITITSTAVRSYLDGDSVPTTPSGLVLRDTKVIPINLGLSVNRTLTVLVYGLVTHQAERENEASESTVDLSAKPLSSSAKQKIITDPNISIPTDFAGLIAAELGAGVKAVGVQFKPINDNAAETTIIGAFRFPYEKEEADATKDKIDPHDLDTEITRGTVWDTGGSAPSTPTDDSGIYAGLKVVSVENVKTDNPAFDKQVVIAAKKNSIDHLELGSIWRPHTYSDIDPNGIETRGMTAKLDGTPATPTWAGLTPVEQFTRTWPQTQGLGTNHILKVAHWGLTDSIDRLQMPGTIAREDPMEGRRTRTDTVFANTLSASDAADSVLAANQNDKTFDGVTVRRHNRAYAIKTLLNTNKDKVATLAGFVSHQSTVRAFSVGGWGDTAAWVKVVAPGQFAGGGLGGFTYGTIVPFEVYRTRGVVWLYRRYINVTDPSSLYNFSLMRYVNNATFLGFPAYTLMYSGAPSQFNYSISGNRVTVLRFRFEFDSLQHINFANVTFGRNYTLVGSYITTNAYYLAQSYFLGTWDILWPGASNFTGAFLS